MPLSETKKILVLYASQTGNSQQAATRIAEKIPSNLPGYEAALLSLDDFLEIEKAAWTQFVLICTSSYGVGQAPMGGYSFRRFCDYIVEHNCMDILNGVHFGLLGLGDSMYTTFFQNPTITNDAMHKAGATQIVKIGKADASKKQLQAIEEWTDNLWKPLKQAVESAPSMTEERLKELQMDTLNICEKAIPDFVNPLKENKLNAVPMNLMVGMPIVIALVAVVCYLLMQSENFASS
eukprot:CAMPEP_0194220672 /NCGR_PEP_ID=MMETSP0156-20130528/28948_1 /TAXON_ID=33649 /ORGANISM="Thalassionema nitzschioides, Strain L26-B" /LENGTH=235 /DNA_ID=CAMNT_0038950797 /DNA_START=77 /DNA_END=784 /DNA_ORIENTATION=+